MILPPRPLKLSTGYLLRSALNVGLAAALAILMATGASRLAILAWTTSETTLLWQHAMPVETVSSVVAERSLGPLHLYVDSIVYRYDGSERATSTRLITVGAVSSQAVHAAQLLRRDPSGRVLTGLEAAAVDRRVVTAWTLFALASIGFALLAWEVWRRVGAITLVRRVARHSSEALVDPAEGSVPKHLRFVVQVAQTGASYRTAATRSLVLRYRASGDEPPLLYVGRRALVLRPDPTSREVVFVRSDFWPFVLDADARSRVTDRILATLRAEQDSQSSSRS